MWKLTLLAYVPLSFVFSILLVPLIIAAGYFYKDTGTLLDNLGSIFFLLLFFVILLLNTLISVVCLLASQVGSSSMMLQYQMDPHPLITNKNISLFLEKSLVRCFVLCDYHRNSESGCFHLGRCFDCFGVCNRERYLHFYFHNSKCFAHLHGFGPAFLYFPAHFYRSEFLNKDKNQKILGLSFQPARIYPVIQFDYLWFFVCHWFCN